MHFNFYSIYLSLLTLPDSFSLLTPRPVKFSLSRIITNTFHNSDYLNPRIKIIPYAK